MSRDVCGICWCPYDEEGKCGCENVKVINPAPSKVMWGTCIRCGKPFRSVDDIHTCTPKALALALADAIERLVILDEVGSNNPLAKDAAAELRRLHAENEQLAEFVVAVGGFWGHSRSKLVGEDSLAECIDGCIEQNEQLRQQNDELDAKLAGLEDRIQSIYGQLNDAEKEVDDLRLLLRQALHALKYRGANEWKVLKPVIEAIKERLG
jgi:chromosome segregation ATPase